MPRRETAAALFLLIATAAVLLHPLLPQATTSILTDDFQAGAGRSDAYTFLWGHWWIHTALSDGRLPWFCDAVFPPTGADLRFHTALWVPAFLTWPLSGLFGTVLLYNVSIAGMLVGAALVMTALLRGTFRLRFPTALLFGALFGFCPYFVFKVHAHPNLAGAFLWGSALAVLVDAVVRRSADTRRGIAFAVLFWLCFWNSLVEAAMLGAAAAVTVGAAAFVRVAVERQSIAWKRPLRWALLLSIGAPSVLFFLPPEGGGLARAVFPGPAMDVWTGFPLLSPFSDGTHDGRFFEYAGTGVPIGIGVLAVWGLLRGAEARIRVLLGICLGVLGVMTLDPFGAGSGVLRTVPGGEAVRVFARFFPFALFFGVVPAATAFDRALADPRRALPAAAAAAAAVLALVETWPREIFPAPAVSLHVPGPVRDAMDEERYVLVLPTSPREYPRRREAYQVELGLPFVHMGHLTREDPRAVRRRAEEFPLLYGGNVENPGALTPADLLRDLERLGVGYLLFDRPEHVRLFPIRGEILHRTPGEILMALPVRAPGTDGP